MPRPPRKPLNKEVAKSGGRGRKALSLFREDKPMLSKDERIFRVIDVPIEKAACYSDLQMRQTLPQKTIRAYAELMRNGSDFPPLDCAELEGEFLVYDGFIRKQANMLNGTATIKVRVTPAEDRDQVVLWAVQAQAHEGLARSNADKEFSVRQLLETDRGRAMTAVDIAKAAGVGVAMVSRYRRSLESSESIIKDNSDSSKQPKKVHTARGLRPLKYKKRKPRLDPRGPIKPPPPPLPKFTREEIGKPAKEIENEPHPDYPGWTRLDVFHKQHGFVQTHRLADKIRGQNEQAARAIIGILRDAGVLCQKFLALPHPLSPEQLIMALEGMPAGGRKVWARNLNQYRAELVMALPQLMAVLEVSATWTPPDEEDCGGHSNGK
jgi:hypothetical protein